LLHAALTNDPALDGMAAVAAAFDFSSSTQDQEPVMNSEMLKLLGLASDATPEQINAAVVALKAKADESETQVTALTQRVAAADEQIAVLKTSHQPGEVVTALKEQLAVLTAESVSRKIDDLVKPALADGRLLPAQESWARDLGKTNLAALSTYIETAQPIAALSGTQSDGKAPDPDKPKLTAEEMAACTLLGQNPDEYLAFKSTNTSTMGAK
jgi:phage I-like protein